MCWGVSLHAVQTKNRSFRPLPIRERRSPIQAGNYAACIAMIADRLAQLREARRGAGLRGELLLVLLPIWTSRTSRLRSLDRAIGARSAGRHQQAARLLGGLPRPDCRRFEVVIAETGADMSCFPSPAHLAFRFVEFSITGSPDPTA